MLYLIISSASPSLKFNKNNVVNKLTSSEHIIGNDPFTEWDECNSMESPPDLIGYHVHALFDGNDAESISFAYKTYHDFISFINPSMSECLFAHSTPSLTQKEVCYFPTTWTETDFPIPSNFIFQTSNYGFYIPPSHLQKSITFWMQHHIDDNNNLLFDYVIHTVSGCQLNDHTKWLIVSGGYQTNLVTDNLVCCHNGPTMCTCNIVQYQIDNNYCLSVQFKNDENINFIKKECETPNTRNIGSWREVIYNQDNNWIQIENYGDMDHSIYLCLGIENDDICSIGNDVKLMDCSSEQDIENDIWISKKTQFIYDTDNDQIKLLGCKHNDNLCLDVNQMENTENVLKLSVASCDEATVFVQRHFFP